MRILPSKQRVFSIANVSLRHRASLISNCEEFTSTMRWIEGWIEGTRAGNHGFVHTNNGMSYQLSPVSILGIKWWLTRQSNEGLAGTCIDMYLPARRQINARKYLCSTPNCYRLWVVVYQKSSLVTTSKWPNIWLAIFSKQHPEHC